MATGEVAGEAAGPHAERVQGLLDRWRQQTRTTQRDRRRQLAIYSVVAVQAGLAAGLAWIAARARSGRLGDAPYRHFADREALESALAAQGLRDLTTDLTEGRTRPASAQDLGDLAVVYVEFALRRPALFRLMFGNACDEGSEERAEAAAEIHELLRLAMANVFPAGDAESLASAGWALAHGLAYLYLDGKLGADSNAEIAEHVRAAVAAILSVRVG